MLDVDYKCEYIVARVYACAIFDIAVRNNSINQWKSMLAVFAKVSKHDLVKSLYLRMLESKRLSDIFIKICEDFKKKIDVFSKNLIFIMAENDRLSLFPLVFREFNNLCFINRDIQKIVVVSYRVLSNIQLRNIIDVIERFLSTKVYVVLKIDKQILSGIIIHIGDTVIDGSVRSRILRLGKILSS